MTSTIRCALAILLLSSVSAAAQDSLDPVRNLYASAEYEEALTAIGRLKSNADLGGVVEIDQYRALCLIALGRSAEADQAIETTVTLDPLYQPAAADASPRVRAAFAAVRHRVLPTVVRSLYASAKAAYDRKAFAEAADGLDKTVRIIDNLEGSNPELGDVRMLASGFLDLSKAAIATRVGASASRAHTRAGEPPGRSAGGPRASAAAAALQRRRETSGFASATVLSRRDQGTVPRHGRSGD